MSDHPGFAVDVWYLTGYATASTPDGRHDWPPGPARLFMAMVAAHYETGEAEGERDVLMQLEQAGLPEIVAARDADERQSPDPFVPENETNKRTTQSIQGLAVDHKRSLRFGGFKRHRPVVPPGHEAVVRFAWPTPGAAVDLDMLDALCRKVTRLGHPMSLVSASATPLSNSPEPAAWERRLVPTDGGSGLSEGTLDELDRRYDVKRHDVKRRRAWLGQEVARQDQESELERLKNTPNVKGTGAQKVNKDRRGKIAVLNKTLKETVLPPPPPIEQPRLFDPAYIDPKDPTPDDKRNAFDSRPILLRLTPKDSPFRRLSAAAGPQVCGRLREALLSHAGQSAPTVLTGHGPDGKAMEDVHIAIAPLPSVGHPHSDGHLLGLMIALPARLSGDDQKAMQGALAKVEKEGLKLGRLGEWSVDIEPMDTTVKGLRPATWVGSRRGSRHWASCHARGVRPPSEGQGQRRP